MKLNFLKKQSKNMKIKEERNHQPNIRYSGREKGENNGGRSEYCLLREKIDRE